MGMAARMGDMTVHGGSVVMGLPTVLIGGMPAARMGDMQVCPMVTPGVPPIPHVGGTIILGSLGVMIGGVPAARAQDMAMCVGPPSSIAMGCPTVMIGDIGSGSGGGAGGGGGAASAASASLASAAMAELEESDDEAGEEEDTENHFLDVSFMDKGKLPVTGYHYKVTGPDGKTFSGSLGKNIRRNGLAEGDYEISLCGIVNAKWDKEEAEVGDEVNLQVQTIGIEDGTPAKLTVYVKDANYTDHDIMIIETEVSGDEINEPYTLELDERYLSICDEKQGGKYSQPFFFFRVTIDHLMEQSGILLFKTTTEIELTYDDGEIIEEKNVRVKLGNGKIEDHKTDDKGIIKLEKVPPANVQIVEVLD